MRCWNWPSSENSLSMYPAAELEVHGRHSLVANAVWQSIGFSVAAAVGVCVAQERRGLVICGDGGFQMTAQALSTMARRALPITVLVLDNGQYGIEQFLLDPNYFLERGPMRPYLALHRWDYRGLAESLGVSRAFSVASRAGLDEQLAAAKTAKGPTFLHVLVREHDLPAVLKSPA
jgi:indolepyruvate decarboxylase